MCRLALINRKGIKHIERKYGLVEFFDHLEQELGGHGNGYCLIHNDGSYSISKGVLLDNSIIVKDILKNIDNIRWVIYHTRLASVGSINDANCHPFEYDRKVLAMNGTERQYKIIKKNLTDTENILLASRSIREDTKQYSSVFLGYEDGKVFANKNYGSLKYVDCGNGGKIFASSFPIEYYNYETVYEAPEFFVEGQKMKNLHPAVKYNYYYGYRRYFTKYARFDDDYDDDYNGMI